MKTLSSSVLPGYGIAGASAALATLAQLPLRRLFSTEHPFPCFYVAILVTAWYAGLHRALLVLILGTLSSAYFFLPPTNSFSIADRADQVGLGLYFASGLAAMILIESLRRQQQEAAEQVRSQAQSLAHEQAARAEAEAAFHRLAEEQQKALALATELRVAKERLARDNQALQRQREAELSAGEAKGPPTGSVTGLSRERLPIRTAYSVMLVRVAEIDFAVSRNRRVFVRVGEVEYPTGYSLSRLEAILPEEAFFRIHDSCIVNLDRIVDLLLLGDHNYEVRLADGRRLPVGRTRCAELRQRLGLEANLS
jgi:DNA-binding LytR/AlgR family response regulator